MRMVSVLGLTLGDKPTSAMGRAIIIHEKADDYKGESGNAGKRIGCGVIRPTPSPCP